jgi:hypothetical protein
MNPTYEISTYQNRGDARSTGLVPLELYLTPSRTEKGIGTAADVEP